MANRAAIAKDVEARLLIESRRRCCLCVYLRRDTTEKQVQIAHISRDPSDGSYENLVVLCLPHHDEYDTRRSQSKGFLPDEVRQYKELLIRDVANGELSASRPSPGETARSVDDGGAQTPAEAAPPAPLTAPPVGEAVPTQLVSTLMEPTREEEARTMLARSNLLSNEIGEIGAIVICARTRAHCAVLIGDKIRWNWELLVFSSDLDKWVLSGHVPLALQKGYEPAAHYVPGSRCGALAVEHVAMTGTGVFLRSTSWYHIGPDRLVRLLTYPIFGYVIGWGLIFQRRFEGHTLKLPTVLGADSILHIEFNAEYRSFEHVVEGQAKYRDMLLFTYAGRLVVEWNENALEFIRRDDSTMTFDDVRGLFDDAHDGFLARHSDRIINLVRHGDYLQRQWVDELLEKSANTEPARAVRAALTTARG